MKTYKIIAILVLKNTLELEDPDNGSIQYYKLHSSERATDYRIGDWITV